MKRDKEVGCVYDGENNTRTVYLCNLFEFLEGNVNLKTTPKIEYKNSHDLLVDGWIVD